MQTKYIGLDAHSSTCTFCVLDAQGTELEIKTIVTNGRLIIDYLQSLGKNINIVFEECDLSFWLFDILHKHVSKIIVCSPAANVQYKRAKTDKLDARNLANLLRGGYLKPVFHDGSGREKFRVILSAYEDIVQDSTRIKNRVEAILRRSRISAKTSATGDAAFILKQFSQRLEDIERIRGEYQARLTAQVKHFKETKYLVSIPGIAYIQAARIIAQVVDPRRFKNKYKFFAYCGLVRHPRQSARRSYGSVRVFGNRMLKCVFKMAAQSSLKGDGCLRKYYDALRAKGLADKSARNAVARKIAAITLSVWRNKKVFNEQMILKSLPVKA
jgi:transposase